MDVSSLAIDIDNLEKSWLALNASLELWETVVVAGVIVDLFVVIFELRHEWGDFKRGTIRTPERPNLWIFLFGFLGAAMVAIGVARELQIGNVAGKIESDIRSKSRQQVSIAEGEAATAMRQAGDAELEAAKANERAGKAIERAATLQKRAEEEALARVKIEERIAGWKLDGAAQKRLLEKLRLFPGTPFSLAGCGKKQILL